MNFFNLPSQFLGQRGGIKYGSVIPASVRDTSADVSLSPLAHSCLKNSRSKKEKKYKHAKGVYLKTFKDTYFQSCECFPLPPKNTEIQRNTEVWMLFSPPLSQLSGEKQNCPHQNQPSPIFFTSSSLFCRNSWNK